MSEEDGILMVTLKDMYDDGAWGEVETCETGSYGAGIQLEVTY